MTPTRSMRMALIAAVLAGCTNAQHHTQADAAPTTQSPRSDASTAGGAAAPGRATPASGNRAASTDAGTTPYLCERGVNACASSGPLVANTQAEARWLLAHGYPSQAEAARLGGMDLAQLNAESQAGNQAATVRYGVKTALSGRFAQGLAILSNAAASGNLYAYYGLSEVYAGNTPHTNRVDSAAYLRLAYLLGDRKASTALAAQGLSGVEHIAVDERAASLYQTYAKNRPPSPRPFD
ncbi:hypothetical protein FHR49_001276 [Xanthomonas campestris]